MNLSFSPQHKDDPLFNEFIESHSKSDIKKVWSNDGALPDRESNSDEDKDSEENEEESDDEADSKKETIAKKNISDQEYMEALKRKTKGLKIKDDSKTDKGHGPNNFFTVKLRGLGYNHKKKDIKLFFKDMKPKSIRVPRKIKGIAYVGFKTEKFMKQALSKNKSFLGKSH